MEVLFARKPTAESGVLRLDTVLRPRPTSLEVVLALSDEIEVGQQLVGKRFFTDEQENNLTDRFDLRRVSQNILTLVAEQDFVQYKGWSEERGSFRPISLPSHNHPFRFSCVLLHGKPIASEVIAFQDPYYYVGYSERYDVWVANNYYPTINNPLDLERISRITDAVTHGKMGMELGPITSPTSFDTDYRDLPGYPKKP